jgi:hypothetical protein
MRKISYRTAAGVGLLIFGVIFLALILSALVRSGLLEYSTKAVIYAWALTITVLFPITTGAAILGGIGSWRRFFGSWLLAMGVLALGSLYPLRPYKDGPLAILIGSVLCVLPLFLSGLFLLLRAKR